MYEAETEFLSLMQTMGDKSKKKVRIDRQRTAVF